MSQYPSPYTPPPFQPNYGYYPPPQDFTRHGRRASTLMFILGGLILLMGACNTFSAMLMTPEQLQQQRAMFSSNASLPLSDQAYKMIALVSAVIMMLVGAGLVTLGTGVRRGGTASTITSLVLASLLLILGALMTLLSLVAGLAAPVMFSISCVSAPGTGLLVLLVIWLIGALRATSSWSAAQRQYQAQYWQYQQNMQAYGTPAAQPMPPAPPASGNEPPRT